MKNLKILARKIFSIHLILLMAIMSLNLITPQPALASSLVNVNLPREIEKILLNKQLLKDANKLLETTPETFCKAYFDKASGVDGAAWEVIEKATMSVFLIVNSISSAAASGAGSLASYAGIASAVSQLGAGGLTTAIAGLMGSNAAGAAATAVVTSAVGGPIVMGIILTSGASITALGTYEVSKFTVEKLGFWVEEYCLTRQ